MKKYLGIDIGGTAIKYALLTENGEFLEKGDTPTPQDTLDHMLEAIDSFASKYQSEISGIAMSAPGRINNKTGYLYTAGAINHYLGETALGDILSEKYHVPVAIDNDAKCAANAELWQGALKDVDSGVVIIIGTGLGGGVVLNHQVWRGRHGASGEISNLPHDYARLPERPFWAGINGVYGLIRPYAAKKGLDIKEVNGKTYFEALKQGDEDAKTVFDSYVLTMVSGIVNMQAILDVDKFCIGGGISAQDCLIDAIREGVDEFFMANPWFPSIKPVIDRCQFKNDANILGALNNFYEVHGH